MKVIFMGTPDFAVSTLSAIAEAGHEILLAVSQPDKPKGRGKQLQFPPVKQWAVEHDIPVYQPKRIKDPEAVEYRPDLTERDLRDAKIWLCQCPCVTASKIQRRCAHPVGSHQRR